MLKRAKEFSVVDVLFSDSMKLNGSTMTCKTVHPCTLFVTSNAAIYLQFPSPFAKLYQLRKDKQTPAENFLFNNDAQYWRTLGKCPEYQEFVKQNFGVTALKSIRINPPLTIPIPHISSVELVSAQPQGQREQKGLRIEYERENMLRQVLLFPQSFKPEDSVLQDVIENIHLRQQLYASGAASIRVVVSSLQNLLGVRVDFEAEQRHVSLLKLTVPPLRAHLTNRMGAEAEPVLSQFAQFQTEAVLWKRLGFQSNKPQSDFRASGLFGLLAVQYAAYSNPGFLLNGSYADWVDKKENLVAYMESQKQKYSYPIATSIIGLSHTVMQLPELGEAVNGTGALFRCLLGDYIEDAVYIINNPREYLEALEKLTPEEMVSWQSVLGGPSEGREQEVLSGYKEFARKLLEAGDATQLGTVGELLTQTEMPFVPCRPLILPGKTLAAVHPSLCGGLFKLIVGLALELNRRLSSFELAIRYTSYAGQLAVLLEDLRQVLRQEDIVSGADVLERIAAAW